jgi:hypothetical protein
MRLEMHALRVMESPLPDAHNVMRFLGPMESLLYRLREEKILFFPMEFAEEPGRSELP